MKLNEKQINSITQATKELVGTMIDSLAEFIFNEKTKNNKSRKHRPRKTKNDKTDFDEIKKEKN